MKERIKRKCINVLNIKRQINVKSLIILNNKNEILKYEYLHNHLEQEFGAAVSITKHKIKDKIKKSSIPFDVRQNVYLIKLLKI